VEPELRDGLVQTSFAVMAVLNRVGAQHDLSLTQVRLLGVLRDRTPKMAELAQFLGLDKSTVSGLVDRAEKRGLVERLRSVPEDGRSIRVALSVQGQQLAATVGDEVGRELSPLTESLPAADRRRMRELLTRIVDASSS
jgi:MarR family transcriptional regulator, lower aerobic nicotinate degradation pathway regulator